MALPLTVPVSQQVNLLWVEEWAIKTSFGQNWWNSIPIVLVRSLNFYYHYQYLRKEIEKVEGDTSIFKSFIANSMIMKICELNKKDYKKYKKKLKEENVYSDLLTDTRGRKIKKWLVSLSPRIYYKIMQ